MTNGTNSKARRAQLVPERLNDDLSVSELVERAAYEMLRPSSANRTAGTNLKELTMTEKHPDPGIQAAIEVVRHRLPCKCLPVTGPKCDGCVIISRLRALAPTKPDTAALVEVLRDKMGWQPDSAARLEVERRARKLLKQWDLDQAKEKAEA